ncbi:hypothetical protein L204_106016 [Cryptococcus depauperatus]|nr:hypothetical protein L204_05145 [Cryptococcus depauperatus CBS 7855]
MPPKGKKTKAEEALDFLSNLDNLDAPADKQAVPPGDTSRASTDSARKSLASSRELSIKPKESKAPQDAEAESALAFLEAQINQKRTKPLSDSRSGTPLPATKSTIEQNVATDLTSQEPANVPTTSETAPVASPSGWGSFWSTATSALQSAQRVADEQYRKVKSEGVSGVAGQLEQLGVKGVPGVDLNKLRKGAEERFGGIVKGVDLEKLRQELVNTTQSTLTTILDTVAPPISEHETLELWLSHPMKGYAGVESVVYRAWSRILEQTESGELVVIWSPSPTPGDGELGERSINSVEGWDAAWQLTNKEIAAVKAREEEQSGDQTKHNPDFPVTIVPIFLYLQPLLAPLPYPEPPIQTLTLSKDHVPPKHLYFLLTLDDPEHSLNFTTVTQPSPSDWIDVPYEQSKWVEERLVEVLKTSVEVIAQDYVATRMGLKPSAPQAAAVAAAIEQAKDGEGKGKGKEEEKEEEKD